MRITSSNFVLPSSGGVNASERYLSQLCSRAFLYLWTYPNLFTDEGISKNGIGKELADVTIVFGNDVILFSDKACSLDIAQPLDIAWGRWYRKAIEKSVRQLHGAMNWLKRTPERVFLDKECSQRPTVVIPTAENARFHLIATTRGTAPIVRAIAKANHNTSKRIASLAIDTSIYGQDHPANPFTVGRVSDKNFVHVFDEESLSLVLQTFDTAKDLIDYLTERTKILDRADRFISSQGEEDLVAIYLSTMSSDDRRHEFPPEFYELPGPSIRITDEHFEAFIERAEVKRKRAADSSSYLIDQLLDRFILTGDPKLIGENLTNLEVETAIRELAEETRFGRRVLADAIIGMFNLSSNDPTRARRVRTLPSATNPDNTFVILLLSIPEEMSYDEYRKFRSAALQRHMECARIVTPERNRYIGLAFDHPNSKRPGGSEDLALFIWPDFTPEDEDEIQRRAKELGIYGKSMKLSRMSPQEFPEDTIRPPPQRKAPASSAKKSKSRRKMAKKSRKANR